MKRAGNGPFKTKLCSLGMHLKDLHDRRWGFILYVYLNKNSDLIRNQLSIWFYQVNKRHLRKISHVLFLLILFFLLNCSSSLYHSSHIYVQL